MERPARRSSRAVFFPNAAYSCEENKYWWRCRLKLDGIKLRGSTSTTSRRVLMQPEQVLGLPP
eukprot:scaffold443863_cov47-Prasinocladus_malaysianus.AAC.1